MGAARQSLPLLQVPVLSKILSRAATKLGCSSRLTRFQRLTRGLWTSENLFLPTGELALILLFPGLLGLLSGKHVSNCSEDLNSSSTLLEILTPVRDRSSSTAEDSTLGSPNSCSGGSLKLCVAEGNHLPKASGQLQ